jgi:hypothetical protein
MNDLTVTHIPTLITYQDGDERERVIGLLPITRGLPDFLARSYEVAKTPSK